MTVNGKPRVGLALGSGMARGLGHIGVLSALKEAGIEPDVIAGTSMGAVAGGAYLTGNLDRLRDWALSLTTFNLIRQMDFSLSSGLVGGEKIAALLDQATAGATFESLNRPFVCIATDLITGHEVWLRHGDLGSAMRASFSLPGVFKPVKIKGRWLVDGALVNPVPVSACHALGAEVVIAVNVNADLLGRKQGEIEDSPGNLAYALERADTHADGGMLSLVQRVVGARTEAPTMFRVMAASLNILLDRIARSRLAGDPADVNVVPRLGHIGLMEFHRAEEAIAEGYAATQRALSRIGDAINMLGPRPHDDDNGVG